jgi:hypothetical protein
MSSDETAGRTPGRGRERQRRRTRKAIVAAAVELAESDPWLGRHLHERVHTGIECRYESDPDHPVRWVLRSAA